MSDLQKQVVRYLSGIIVTAAAGLIAHFGLKLNATQYTPYVALGVAAVYGVVVRFIERKVPGAGTLLGVPGAPTYPAKAAAPAAPAK